MKNEASINHTRSRSGWPRLYAISVVALSLFSVAVSTAITIPYNIIFLLSPLIFLSTIITFWDTLWPRMAVWPIAHFTYWVLIAILSLWMAESFGTLFQISVVLLSFVFLSIGYNSAEYFVYHTLLICSCVICGFAILERLTIYSPISIAIVSEFSRNLREAASGPGGVALFGRATGLFSNPNSLGFYCVTTFFALEYLRGSARSRILHYIALALIVLALLLTFSRGSIGAFLVGYAALTVARLGSKNLLSSSLVSLMVLAASALSVYLVNIEAFQSMLERVSAFQSVFDDRNFEGRTQFWASVWESKYVLFGTFVSPESVFGHAIDNLFLRFLAHGGLVGFTIAVALFLNLLWLSKSVKSRQKRGAAVAFSLAVVINSLTMLGFLDISGLATFWLMYGIVVREQTQRIE